jgi:hypothetical protein
MNRNIPFILKLLFLFFLLNISVTSKRSYGQTVLSPGDIAFVSIEMSGSPDDYFEFVTLVDLWPCTVVNFTDNMYKTGGTFCTDEFSVGFTVTQKIPAGTIVKYSCSAIPGAFTMSAGAAIPVDNGAGSNNGLSSSDDNVSCYQGTINTGSMVVIASMHSNLFTTPNSCGNSNTSALPAGLTLGVNAVQTGSSNDNRRYNCAVTTGTKATLGAAINTAANWQNSAPSACTFTVTSVAACSGGPANPPTSYNCTGTTVTSSSFSWARCNNMEVIVVARKSSDPATDPVDGVNYSANTVYGSGSALGFGYAVYKGTNTSVTVTNLTPGTSYTFDIYTFYSTSGICFNTTQLSGNCTTALPLELLYFNVHETNDQLYFNWALSSIKNINHFELEASTDGISFVTIGTIDGIDTEKCQCYNFSISSNKTYTFFRLKQIDNDETIQFSEIEQLSANEFEGYQIFPIPAVDEVFVETSNLSNGNLSISILDLTGKELYNSSILLNSSESVYPIVLKNLLAGTYFIEFTHDNKKIRNKFYKL